MTKKANMSVELNTNSRVQRQGSMMARLGQPKAALVKVCRNKRYSEARTEAALAAYDRALNDYLHAVYKNATMR